MASRAIHIERSIFGGFFDPTIIPDGGVVYFNNILADYYAPMIINGSTSGINHIIYYTETGKFLIQTTSLTENDFLIYWAICLTSSTNNQVPVFSIVVEKTDASLFGVYPSNAAMRSDTLCGSVLLHLPTPASPSEPVDYMVSLVNHTGTGRCCPSCFYKFRNRQSG